MPHHTWTLDTASNIHLFPFFHFCCVSGRPWICRTFTISLEPSRQMICWPVTCQVSECSEVTSDHGSSGTCRPHLGLGPLRPLGPMEPMFNNIDVAQYLENAPSGAFFLKGLQAVWHRIYKDTIRNRTSNTEIGRAKTWQQQQWWKLHAADKTGKNKLVLFNCTNDVLC